MTEKNSVILSGEKVITTKCLNRDTSDGTPLNEVLNFSILKLVQYVQQLIHFFLQKIQGQNTLFVSCSIVQIDNDNGEIITSDCVNGTWMPDDFNGGLTNYSYLSSEYNRTRQDPDFRAKEISYEEDIMLFENRTKLKINIEGCVNTLSEECKDFYSQYGT